MRHRNKRGKLGRKTAHRKSLLSNLCGSLIEHRRIRTTLGKARALRPVAEKMVTLAKKAHAAEDPARKLHLRRQALAFLKQRELVATLFDEVGPASADRSGGYTRITKLGPRMSDSAPMAFIEWVDLEVEEPLLEE